MYMHVIVSVSVRTCARENAGQGQMVGLVFVDVTNVVECVFTSADGPVRLLDHGVVVCAFAHAYAWLLEYHILSRVSKLSYNAKSSYCCAQSNPE